MFTQWQDWTPEDCERNGQRKAIFHRIISHSHSRNVSRAQKKVHTWNTIVAQYRNGNYCWSWRPERNTPVRSQKFQVCTCVRGGWDGDDKGRGSKYSSVTLVAWRVTLGEHWTNSNTSHLAIRFSLSLSPYLSERLWFFVVSRQLIDQNTQSQLSKSSEWRVNTQHLWSDWSPFRMDLPQDHSWGVTLDQWSLSSVGSLILSAYSSLSGSWI